MPDPDRLLRTLHKAAEVVRQTPGRRGRVVHLPPAADVLVAGDLHGNLANFQAVYQYADLANQTGRHLVLQELIHGKAYYPNGGDKSHQLLDLFAALKCQFPARVHLLLGNHELAQWTNRLVMKEDRDLNGLFVEGIQEAYGDRGAEIYEAYLRLFGTLPLAIRTANRICLSHSLPRQKALDAFELRHLETDAFPPEDLTVGGSAYELLWGRDTRAETCEAFLKKVDCDWLVSGHIAAEAGYAQPTPRQLIVDCCDHPAAFVLLPADRPLTQEEFDHSVYLLDPAG
jgi:Calcineurin-like phosphoesterase